MNKVSSASKSILLVSNLFSVGSDYGAVCQELEGLLTAKHWRVTTTSSLQNRYLRPIDMILTVWRSRHDYQIAQIDVFSGMAFRWAEWSVWMLKKMDKPIVLTLHGGNLPGFALKYPQRVQALLNSADVVITPSRYLLEAMYEFRPDVVFIPNPIYVNKYAYRCRTKSRPRCLFLRALQQNYNPNMAIKAGKLLLSDYPDLHLAFVGPDRFDGTSDEMNLLIDQFSLHHHVTIVGAVLKEKVPDILDQFDIFLNTTNIDNTPISIIEAMASGMCIISTDVGGIPYLLTHEYNALLVPPDDHAAMAKAIQRILSDTELASYLSHNARLTAEAFDWSKILPMWEQLLTRVIGIQ